MPKHSKPSRYRAPALKLFTFVFVVDGIEHHVNAKGVDRLSAHSNAAAILRRELVLPVNVSLLGRSVTFKVGDKLPAMIGG